MQVTFDAADPHVLARWWAALLGYEVEDHHEVVSKLLEDGVVTDDDVAVIDGRMHFADATAITAPDASGPRLYFQVVPEPKMAKNRVHLDIPVEPGDLDAEVARVVEAGGALVEYGSHPGHRWAVMRDPEGNEFCLH